MTLLLTRQHFFIIIKGTKKGFLQLKKKTEAWRNNTTYVKVVVRKKTKRLKVELESIEAFSGEVNSIVESNSKA